MRHLGLLVQWNDVRGFGFVQRDGTAERVFVHISAFQLGHLHNERPKAGMYVTFSTAMVDGKLRALQVECADIVAIPPAPAMSSTASASAGAPRRTATHTRGQVARSRAVRGRALPATAASARPVAGYWCYGVLLIFLLLFVGIAVFWGVPVWVASLYWMLSVITFFTYWKDKAAARTGRWRTPESTLHTLALLGGWPGALLAQQWLRHKSKKSEFQWVMWITVALNIAIFTWLHSPWGRDWLPMFYAY